ncbi:MAG: YidC/Oxa1 family membrane protein insertase [Alphaproteobacteria bacterium]|nr:YidC/Oxa1 family membrane protein insertase [Alphaproteobacteria bacterium]
MFYNIFIFPMVLFLEIIIRILEPLLEVNPILAVFFVSFFVNFLSHPVFVRVENLCQKDRDIYQKLLPRIASIKRNFKGNEQRMLLRTFFRQNHYHPFWAHLKQSLMIFLQVPIFIASYQVISKKEVFKSIFMDGLNDFFSVGDFSIRLLPILMTIINLLSVSYYLKNKPTSAKIYACILPAVFLVLLYEAPASIVLYWIFNNYFSLLRNVFFFAREKIKYYALSFVIGVIILAFVSELNLKAIYPLSFVFVGYLGYRMRNYLHKYEILPWGILVFLLTFMTSQLWFSIPEAVAINGYVYFLILIILGCICYSKGEKTEPSFKCYVGYIGLMLLTFSLYLPIKLINSDPDLFHAVIGLSDLISGELEMGIGTFVVYPLTIFLLMRRFRRAIRFITLTVLLMGFYHLWTFTIENDTINSSMRLGITTFDYDLSKELTDLYIDCGIIIFVFFIIKKSLIKYFHIVLASLYLVYLASFLGNVKDLIAVQKDIAKETKEMRIELSKSGKNVLILFMDRAISGFFPLIFEEKPELKEEFSGFVYYPYTVSFATQTLYSAPSLLGGYEYTPLKLQNDRTRQMVDKHNESISVLPELFRKNDYRVFLIGVPSPNYDDPTHPPVFYSDIVVSENKPYRLTRNEFLIQGIKRNMFSFNLLRLSSRIFQKSIYNNADYFSDSIWRFYQNTTSQGALAIFDAYIDQLKVTDQKQGNLLILISKLPHEPTLLDENYGYFNKPEDINDEHLNIQRNHSLSILLDRMHYDVNMLSYLELAKLFQKMKASGVYDQTKIIVVSDHGWIVNGLADINPNITQNHAVLLVKDFNATGPVKINSTFMTTADVPFLATQGLMRAPRNPFTQKPLSVSEKDKGVDIIDTHLKKWSPRHYKNKSRTSFYEEDVVYRHIDKNSIKDVVGIETKEDKK